MISVFASASASASGLISNAIAACDRQLMIWVFNEGWNTLVLIGGSACVMMIPAAIRVGRAGRAVRSLRFRRSSDALASWE